MRPRPFFMAVGLAVMLAGCSDSPPEPKSAPAPPGVQGQGVPVDLSAGKFDEAIAGAEETLKTKPEDRQALATLVLATQTKASRMGEDRKASSGIYFKSATAARKLRGTFKNLTPPESALTAQALYNEACALAREGQGDRAMASLAEAFDAGFQEVSLFETDGDLDSLRARPDFQEFRKGISRKILARLAKGQTPFPFALDVADLDGKTISLDDLKGKVAIIDFWGTWCPPCRQEIPVLSGFARKYRDQGLAVVGINCGEGPEDKARPRVLAFLRENKVPYPCAMSDGQIEAQIPNVKQGLPITLFLDRTGKVRLKWVGFDPGEAGVMEQVIKALLEEE
jgi:thiol-disulfide isomerase/thioredoxin